MFQIIDNLYKKIKPNCMLLTNHEIINYNKKNNILTVKNKESVV